MEGWCGRDQAGGSGLYAFDSGCTGQWRALSGPTAPATRGRGGGTVLGPLTYKVKNLTRCRHAWDKEERKCSSYSFLTSALGRGE
jgi:hypothetical protein